MDSEKLRTRSVTGNLHQGKTVMIFMADQCRWYDSIVADKCASVHWSVSTQTMKTKEIEVKAFRTTEYFTWVYGIQSELASHPYTA